jgi:lysophospholipase L1-like esterase
MRKFLVLGIVMLTLVSCSRDSYLSPAEPQSLTLTDAGQNVTLTQTNTKLPWYSQVLAYRQADELSMPKPGGIVLVGSSTVRLWSTLQTDLSGYSAIGRGLGGSTLQDQINYFYDIIKFYKPRQVVIICGENEIYGGWLSWKVNQKFQELFRLIRSQLPSAKITFVSMKPSPYMWGANPLKKDFSATVINSNQLIKKFIATQSNASYVDSYSKLLKWPGGYLRPELYKSDKLHLNAEGYKILTLALKPHLTYAQLSYGRVGTVITPGRTTRVEIKAFPGS